MALLPRIPDRPTDRPETWSEYRARRATIALHRQLFDELTAWLRTTPAFDPFTYFWPDPSRNQVVCDFLASERRELIFADGRRLGFVQDTSVDFTFEFKPAPLRG